MTFRASGKNLVKANLLGSKGAKFDTTGEDLRLKRFGQTVKHISMRWNWN